MIVGILIFGMTTHAIAAPNTPSDLDVSEKVMRYKDTASDYVVYNGKQIPVPRSYIPSKFFSNLGDEVGSFREPDQIFIDDKDRIYIVDTGNDRVVKMNTLGTVMGVYYGPEDKPFKSPRGIFVDDDGSMYIADTGNGRIVHLSMDGEFIEEFVKPDSPLIRDITFEPFRISIHNTGFMYVLNQANFRGFMVIDAYNEFRGYMGATQIPIDFFTIMWRLFGTEEQKKKIAQQAAPPYTSFCIDESGSIYATLAYVTTNQIVKLNTVGENTYPEQVYGGVAEPFFVDIDIDKNGIISVLDSVTNRIYQYDQEGNMLTSFGGKGNWKGRFEQPVSLAQDSEGNIYVLDKKLNHVQVFEPTNFIKLVQKATKHHMDGEYEQAMEAWREVLKIDSTYQLAFRGVAKAYTKQENWKEAVRYYKLGDDKEGYTMAFSEYRHQLFREYFGWVVLAIVVGFALLILIGKAIIGFARNEIRKYTTWQGGI